MGIPANFTPQQTAELLILRNFWAGSDSPWKDAELTVEELAQHWNDLWPDLENQGCPDNVRYHGTSQLYSVVKPRIHYSWERNYDVETRVIYLGDDRGLAYNYVSGGGKHGSPESYPWWTECWFVKCIGTTTIVKHAYEDIPEVKSDEPAS